MKNYLFVNANIIDGKKDSIVQNNKAVFIKNGKIERITNTNLLHNQNTKDYTLIDLQGRYLMPGLINMHVHLPATGKPKEKASDPKKLVKLITSTRLTNALGVKLCSGYAKTELLSGVTTIRTVGGIKNYDTIIRDKITKGKLLGPRVLASNMAISVPGGHMAGSLAYEAHSEQEARELVNIIYKEKPDLIKLMITGGVMDAEVVGEPGVLRMPPSYVKACCDEAHKLGMKVAAHVESPEGVLVALQNGVDSIEHGAMPNNEIIELYKKTGAFQVSTLSPAIPYALFDTSVSHATYEQNENGKVVFNGIKEMAKECLKNDIPVGLGTDTGCPFVTHYDMWRELCFFVKYCDVTPQFALYSATLLNAKLAGIDKITGSVEEGKEADLIVCKTNPLENLSALRNLDMVMARGNLINNPKPKKMPIVEQEMDKYL